MRPRVLLNHSFTSFYFQKEVELVTFFRPKAADRVECLKRRVDSGDIFHKSSLGLSEKASQYFEEGV